MKEYHDGAAMTSSVIDAMLILTCMLQYYQIADNTPFTSNAIERKRLQLLTELLVSDCRVLMDDWLTEGKHSKLG